jgi:hypothetical protein
VGAKRHQAEANASDARSKITRYANGPSTEKLRKKKKIDTIYEKKVNITHWDILIQNPISDSDHDSVEEFCISISHSVILTFFP